MAIHSAKQIVPGLEFESNAKLDLSKAKTLIRITNKANSYTVTEEESGTTYTTYGGANGMVFTLPIKPKAGLSYRFIDSTANTIVVATANANTFMAYGDAAATSVSVTDIGCALEVIADGNQWVCLDFGSAQNNATVTVTA